MTLFPDASESGIHAGMDRDPRRSLAALGAALLLTLLSVVSAYLMAPDREAMAERGALVAMGAGPADLCGPDAPGHTHRCPFCHKLPDPPRLSAPDACQRLSRPIGNGSGRDLVLGPQHLGPDVSARAPPCAA